MDRIDKYHEMLNRYSALLGQRNADYAALMASAGAALDEMRDLERLRPPTFNIFFALGHAYREVSTHSAMLAHLLDPAKGHAQGTLFLRKFLDIIQREAEHQGIPIRIPRLEDGSRWQCRNEVGLPRGLGRADILLRGPDLLLVIENKVHASDLEGQLSRYWEYAHTEAAHHHLVPLVVYLTPDGHPPTPQSMGEASGLASALVRLSYNEDIYELVQSTTGAISAVSVAEVLRQYAALVRRLA